MRFLGAKCVKNAFAAGADCRRPTGGGYSAPPDPLSGLPISRRPTSNGRRGEGEEGMERKGRSGKGRVLLFPRFEPCHRVEKASEHLCVL